MTSNPDSAVLRAIRPFNLLSFGPDTPLLSLEPLNVLVGPNGSGKSNLVEAISLLRAAPRDTRDVLRRGGGAREWIWKGDPDAPAGIEAVVRYPQGRGALGHTLAFRASANGVVQFDAENVWEGPTDDHAQRLTAYDLKDGRPMLFVREEDGEWAPRLLKDIDTGGSILAQRRDPEQYPEITYLADLYETFRIHRDWRFGRDTVYRVPQRADQRTDRLEDDFSNLALVLNRLRRAPAAKAALLDGMRALYDGLDDFDVSVEGGTVQVFLIEGRFTIPASRLSDGTLRYLCLLAILLDPKPPALICIEEPELGLHPDILPTLADHLLEASSRTQIVATTHSDILVDALSEHPECVVVCEKHDGQTRMQRLARADLAEWLKTYRLGQIWTKGEIGGTRLRQGVT